MSKVNKFRAWDKIDKNFIYSDWKYGIVSFWDTICNDYEKRYEPEMQWTGLTDKNGVEIYEGDIVKTRDIFGDIKQYAGGQYYVNHPNANHKYSHQIHCEVCEVLSPVFFLDFFDPYEIEVVGNSLANPELL